MIFDNRWKWELKKISWTISLSRKLSVYSEYAKFRLNRAILYSATILRKIIEDEIKVREYFKEKNYTFSDSDIVNIMILSVKYPYVDEKGWTIRGKILPSSYGKGEVVSLKVKDVCNWVLYSYVFFWGGCRLR